MSESEPEQLALLREEVRPVKAPDATALAPELPVARVAVDVSLSHLDRPFDYLIPADMHEAAVPGGRVQVRFAGKRVAGYLLERVAESNHDGRLGTLAKVVSPEVVLRPDVARLVREVADRQAGTFADVVRLAVPPRHARVEKRAHTAPKRLTTTADPEAWQAYEHGPAYLRALAKGEHPRACLATLAGPGWADEIAAAVQAVIASGRGAIVCAPDAKDVARIDAALRTRLGDGHHVTLTADLGPSARYAAFLALSRGDLRVVVGTRGAAFAPVHDLGLVAIWDDGDDLFAEPRAPYPHARDVLLSRAYAPSAGSNEADRECAVLIAGHARSCEAQQLVESGWCVDVSPSLPTRRARWPRIAVAGADERAIERDQAANTARLPHEAFELVRRALQSGPVLVQVPRQGYRTALACQRCRTPARCGRCRGPLWQPGARDVPRCRWCGHEGDWACGNCGARELRAPVVGEVRTAEELGRAFPRFPVTTSSGSQVRESVSAEPGLVIATPGAEPVADGGYAAALLMDCWLMLARPDLRATEESLRRWLNAVALVGADGQVLAMGDPGTEVMQALVRADAVGHARRQLAERQQTRLPPAVRLATVEGPSDVLEELVEGPWPEPVEVLGPVPFDDAGPGDDGAEERGRLIVRVPRDRSRALVEALRYVQAGRSARKLPPVRVDVDPATLQ